MINASLRSLVRRRAHNACEYCGLAEEHSPIAALQVDHIQSRKHGGTDDSENLALACIDCNLSKGSNIAGIDPTTGTMCELFHPRRQQWDDHFEWRGIQIVGKTKIGRTTVEVLRMNSEEQLQLRMAIKP